jgi:hypothetical protein
VHEGVKVIHIDATIEFMGTLKRLGIDSLSLLMNQYQRVKKKFLKINKLDLISSHSKKFISLST